MELVPEKLFLEMLDKERNIYEPAVLYHQNRKNISDYIEMLAEPDSKGQNALKFDGNEVYSEKTGKKYPVSEQVVDFISATAKKSGDLEWERLNKQFLNYHKSLTVYTMINSMPIANYIALKSGMAAIRNKTIVDIGGGTGHVLASFFHYPETLNYILADPNLRLLHDQFLRVFPKLTTLKMSHVLCYAEELPFKNESTDVVMSLSAIDHFKDYKAFFFESARILKPGGTLFLSSHLDLPVADADATRNREKILNESFFERLARYLYYRKHKVGHDDHTYHFTDLEPFITSMEQAGLRIKLREVFKRYFFIVAEK